MRPDYDGIKYYGKNDMSIGWELEDSEEELQGISSESKVENINKAIELFNIAQLLDTEVRLRKWDENTYNGYKAKSPLLIELCAKFFFRISNDSFMHIEESVCISYLEDFWMLIEKFKVYERINKDTFKRFLEKSKPTLWVILKHKRIVDFFGRELADVLKISEQTPELIAHNFLESGVKIRYHFPKELRPSEYEKILKKYVENENANPNYLHLIMIYNSTKECPISDKLKLAAKKAYHKYWENNQRSGTGIEYGAEIAFGDVPDVVVYEKEGLVKKYTYDIKWLKENLDYPTILNNFIFLFEYFDVFWRCAFVAVKSQMDVFEKHIGIKGKQEYIIGTSFNMCNITSTLQMNAYYNFLQKNNISLELVIKWFFEEYLKEEFGADGFVYNPPKNDANWLDKCKNISSEMDGVLKQYRMYVEDGQIDRELLEMSSEHIVLSSVPSFLEDKYAYAESMDMHNKMRLLFSDQSTITYTEKTKSTYNSFCLLIMSEEMRRSDFFEYQLPSIVWLIEKNVLYVDGNDVLKLNREYIAILADMYKHDAVCVQYYGKYKTILAEMKDSNDIRMGSTLFSVPETNYLNYMLNRSEYSNGKDLRNKYIHSTYPLKEDVQMQDYMDLLKIMIIIIGKINEEFLLR
ncbi:hypothetical protein ACTQ6A_07715 [Lachnospiraceae bacterium LCP25S3_G4]